MNCVLSLAFVSTSLFRKPFMSPRFQKLLTLRHNMMRLKRTKATSNAVLRLRGTAEKALHHPADVPQCAQEALAQHNDIPDSGRQWQDGKLANRVIVLKRDVDQQVFTRKICFKASVSILGEHFVGKQFSIPILFKPHRIFAVFFLSLEIWWYLC